MDVQDPFGQFTPADLARRQVDAHPHRQAGLAPGTGVTAGLAQDPLADRLNQAGDLRDGDESTRHDQPVPGVAPPRQRLDADESARVYVELRLVEHCEFVTGEGLQQALLYAASGHHLGVHFGFEERKTAAALGLRPVKRNVGVLEQQFEGVTVLWEQRDADAPADHGAVVIQIEWLA